MTAGRSYAVRIKAVDNAGYDLFKNQGYSEVLLFTFGDPCSPPTDLLISNIAQRSADFVWTPTPKNSAFRLELREVSTTSPYPISDWYSYNYNVSKASLSTLEAGKKYEYRIYGNCQSLISEPTLSEYFNTIGATTQDFKCNQNQLLTITGSIPTSFKLPSIGQYLDINGLKTKILQVEQQGTDMISGIATIEIPFLNGLSIPIKFTNLKLTNMLESLASGNISFIKDFVQDNVQNLTNTATNGLNNAVNNVTNGVTNGINNVTNGVTNGVNNATNTVTNGVNNATNGVTNGINNVTNGVTNGVNNATNTITNGVNNAANTVTNGVNNSTNTVTNGVNNTTNTITNGVNNAANTVTNGVNNSTNTVTNGVNNATNTITNGVNNAANTVTNGVNNTANTVTNGVNNATNGTNTTTKPK
jgi:hypothetical protein